MSQQRAILEYTQFPMKLLLRIAEILEKDMWEQQQEFREVELHEMTGFASQTHGLASWFKYTRDSLHGVSLLTTVPIVDHIKLDNQK